MSTNEKRHEQRLSPTVRLSPISCFLVSGGDKAPLTIVNYHYRGACFQSQTGDYRVLEKDTYLQFKIGMKDLSEKITYKIIWETIAENGQFGVEFSTSSSYVLARSERFFTHTINTPTVSSRDPIDPNRIIYFRAVNLSTTGLLLSTSLSNKHIFPGMELRGAILEIPGMGKTEIDLYVENCRPTNDEKTVLYGTSVKGSSHNYITLISKYISNLGRVENSDDRLEKLASANLIQKNLSQHLTISEVRTPEEYASVLKLRFLGYKLAGKAKDGATYLDMGEGLEHEGIVLAARLGGQMIASCEFRILKKHGSRIAEKLDIPSLPGVRNDNLAEINKLVVHPRAQNTDVVLGIFQKVHALAMLNGQPDGLIMAEDKLVALYERLGFKKAGYSQPHAIKPNVKLHLMIIHGEAYATSEGMNPYAWSMAFQESHKFFSEIGVQRASKMSPRQILLKNITRLIVTLFKNKKKEKSVEIETKNGEQTKAASHAVYDPRWTKQHLNATVMLPYVLEAITLIGEDKTSQILLEFSMTVDYFRKASNWVSIEFFDEFIAKFSKFGDPYLLNRKAGYRSTTKEILGANYFIMKHFFSPRLAFKSFESFLPKFNKTRVYKVVDSGSSYCRIRITNPDKELIPKHHSARENWIALIDAYVQILTGESANIDVVKSTFDGDNHCEYLVRWKNPIFTFKNAFSALSAISLLIATSAWVFSNFTTGSILLASTILTSSIGLIICALQWRKYAKRYADMIDSLASVEKEADEKYRELQSSKSILEKGYQEGKVLESINREIQTSDDLTNILQIALEAACSKFEFKRAFTMIIDENNKYLRTAAVFGTDQLIKDIWEFKVDVSIKRENPVVLSSVYLTGQSILINELDQHKFHLNEASRRLIDALGTKGFVMVPIPSGQKNWGVLIADKGSSGDIITRRDLVALQRVSQSIGLALDKKAKIDSEIKVRRIFQKYVPSAIVESTLGMQEPRLGGESKDAICLFLDIRNFTKISAQLPPQILVETLNKIFDLLQKTTSEYQGVIDKFLGDGALVTWGVIPGSLPKPDLAIQSAIAFSEKLRLLNAELAQKAMPAIEVGFGFHRGQVIAGNIGSNERMEFTVIGSTVNVASRLEQLTKVFKSQIVISESLMPFSQLDSSWEIHRGIHVRGVEEPLDVACLKVSQFPTKRAESA